jgi:biotin transport system substrate-specific component
MPKSMAKALEVNDGSSSWAVQGTVVVGASLFVALCARISVPLPFTPVPLTVQNMGVLLVGLLLGSRAGFGALCLYLMEGVMGLPVFSPAGPGGIAQLLGPTGGFLLAYPLVAWLAGYLFEQRRRGMLGIAQSSFVRALLACTAAEVLLFMGGLTWLFILTHSVALAFRLGLYWFVLAEVIKIMLAAGIASAWQRGRRVEV